MATRNSSGRSARTALRVMLYLRMSCDQQDQSIPSQRAELTSYAKKQGYSIVGEYIDEAISGDDTDRRPGFLQMRDDAQSGKFDVVLCWDQDRFGRFDLLDAGYWIMPFRQGGVRLETIAQGKIDWEDLVGQLIYSVNQLGKAQFLRDIARNTARGMLTAAKEGRAGTGGPSPYGYRHKDGRVEVVESAARVVRWIFERYLEPDGSIRAIAVELNQRKVLSPSGSKWTTSSVQRILSRRKYTGTFVYGERNGGKYYSFRGGEGEIVPRRRGEGWVNSQPIIHENKFEAIVSKAIFEQVQAKFKRNQTKTTRRKARNYLLSGLVRCGDCGGTMGGKTEHDVAVYRCRRYLRTGTSACYCNYIREAPLVSVITRQIQQEYLSEPALNRLRQALQEEQNRSKPKLVDRDTLKVAIEKLDRKIDNAQEVVLEAPPELRTGLYRKLETFTSERTRLQSELQSLSRVARRSRSDDAAEIETAIEALRNLGEALRKARPEDSRELLASIVSRVELHFKPGTGRYKRDFSHGTIYLRPNAGGSAGSGSPGVPHMSTKGSLRRPRATEILRKSWKKVRVCRQTWAVFWIENIGLNNLSTSQRRNHHTETRVLASVLLGTFGSQPSIDIILCEQADQIAVSRPQYCISPTGIT